MKTRYNQVELDLDGEIYKKITSEKDGWGFFCENHHGTCYWNSETGEICWAGDSGYRLQQLAE